MQNTPRPVPVPKLYATTGIDPRTMDDRGAHLAIEELIRSGQLDDVMAAIQTFKEHILTNVYDRRAIDSIMNGCQVTDAEAFAFGTVYRELRAGTILMSGFHLHKTPSFMLDDNIAFLSRLRFTNKGSKSTTLFHVFEDVDGITITIVGPLTLWKSHKDVKQSKEEIQTGNLCGMLDVGFTSACRTLSLLLHGIPVARWAYESTELSILYPTGEFIETYAWLKP
jgi:hypothetical protein